MAIWPPAESRGKATHWWLAQKPSHSPGVVRLSPRRLVRCVSRCSTLPCVCRKRELGPGTGRGQVSDPGPPPSRATARGHRANPAACSPKMLCSDFWLGLLAKPLEGPVLAEREVVALPGEASEDGEE